MTRTSELSSLNIDNTNYTVTSGRSTRISGDCHLIIGRNSARRKLLILKYAEFLENLRYWIIKVKG